MQEGKIITAHGVSAGIDMSLYLASQIGGVEKAKAYQLFNEYNPEPPFQSGNIKEADGTTIELAKKILAKGSKKEFGSVGYGTQCTIATGIKTW